MILFWIEPTFLFHNVKLCLIPSLVTLISAEKCTSWPPALSFAFEKIKMAANCSDWSKKIVSLQGSFFSLYRMKIGEITTNTCIRKVGSVTLMSSGGGNLKCQSQKRFKVRNKISKPFRPSLTLFPQKLEDVSSFLEGDNRICHLPILNFTLWSGDCNTRECLFELFNCQTYTSNIFSLY